jgi:uncharacterized membrane protein YsdA (DUF1294 family)
MFSKETLVFFCVYILWNGYTFFLVWSDKNKARKRVWRIPEKVFFRWALFLGAGGILLGMRIFRHKTKHYKFTLGMPVLFLINLIVLYFAVVQMTGLPAVFV